MAQMWHFMSRNRTEVLLKMIHFSDNAQCPEVDHLYKVQQLLNAENRIIHQRQHFT